MKVLIVDDANVNCEILKYMLQDEELEFLTAADGAEALSILEEQYNDIHTILLDLMMPRMDGFTLMEELRKRSWFPDIPIIVTTSENEKDAEIRAMELGADDFIQKPFVRSIILQRVKNAGHLYLHKKSLETLVDQQTQKLREQAIELRKNNEKIIDILGTVVEYRNLESGEHIFRVKEFTRILAQNMMEIFPECGLTREQADLIITSSPLHDIGKITIPDSIMLKPGRLTPEEYERMKEHTTNGAEMLKHIKGAWDEDYSRICYEICLYHHERFDGNGYPMGLKGDEIPLSAQLVSIADVYDALVNRRVYKEAYSLELSYEMVISGQCGVFSPQLLECFRHSRRQFEALMRRKTSD